MPQAASATRESIEGVDSVVLREPSTGSEVQVAVGLGSNVSRFRTRVGGREVEILATTDMATLRERPTRWGTACLFPYPGRIKEGRFTFRGRDVRLPTDGRDGNAIHGVVRQRPWDVAAMIADEGRARTTTRITTGTGAISPDEWPWPFELELTISLSRGVLRIATAVANAGSEAMPMGLGFHPYFPTPFGPGDSGQCEVWIDGEERWGQIGGLPTGEIQHVGPTEPLRVPTPLARIETATGVRNQLVRRAGGSIRGGVRDPINRVAATVAASPEFSRMVFYTPESPPVVSLEPQTCVPNAHRMANESDLDTGLVVIEPGGGWQGWFEISAEAI